MAHRKTRAGKVNQPVNENWVKNENLNELKKAALKQVAIRNEYEKTHKLEAIRVNSKTVILREVK